MTESVVRLYRHEPGTLTRLDRYLHKQTGGIIGGPSQLVRTAALTVTETGDKAINRDLDDIPVDCAAESDGQGAA